MKRLYKVLMSDKTVDGKEYQFTAEYSANSKRHAEYLAACEFIDLGIHFFVACADLVTYEPFDHTNPFL